MASSRKPVDRDDTPPFLIKVYYRTGAYLRTEELLGDPHPPHKSLYAWKDSTLKELSEALSSSSSDGPTILPHPFIGTRLEYRHVFRAPVITNSRSTHVEPLRFLHKDIGSVVFGAGRPGASSEEDEWDGISNDTRTLEDIRFVQGDHLICAIMPPDESTGTVVPSNTARVGRGHGIGEAGGGGWAVNDIPDGGRYGFNGGRGSGGGFGRGGGFARGGGRRPSRGGGSMDHQYQSYRQRRDYMPSGDWSRGEVPGSNPYR